MSTRVPNQRNLTSGNLTVDRRADYAAMLAESGDHAAAAELMAQSMELAPDWAAGWFLLAGHAEKAGDLALARSALERVLVLSGDDIFGAGLKLAALGAAAMPAIPPSAYVEGLFDDYAEKFDAALVDRLGYNVPESLGALVASVAGPDHRFGLTVDLGCGTGLFGAVVKHRTDRLEGWDLSANMLAKARTKALYDHLGRADLSLPHERSGLFDGLPPHRADLVSAADVMMYLGDLEAALNNVAALVRPGGIIALSVEKASVDTGYELRASLRYAHSPDHMDALFARHGWTVVASHEQTIRMDAGAPVTGMLYVLSA